MYIYVCVNVDVYISLMLMYIYACVNVLYMHMFPSSVRWGARKASSNEYTQCLMPFSNKQWVFFGEKVLSPGLSQWITWWD